MELRLSSQREPLEGWDDSLQFADLEHRLRLQMLYIQCQPNLTVHNDPVKKQGVSNLKSSFNTDKIPPLHQQSHS
jgi:hypothetical protein